MVTVNLNNIQLKPTSFSTVSEKEKFIKQFQKFVTNGYLKRDFPRWFYNQLSMCFMLNAHYSHFNFYNYYFDQPFKHYKTGITEFEEQVKNYSCWGDPTCTYSDVERFIKEWLITYEPHI